MGSDDKFLLIRNYDLFAHITDEDIGRHEPFYVYPFAPCKEECILPWKQEYEKLAKKYNIDITKRIIK